VKVDGALSKSPGPNGFNGFDAVGVRAPELSVTGHEVCWPYVAAWFAGKRAKGLLLCSVKKGLLPLWFTTELVAVRSTNWPKEESSQREVSGEKMPWVLVVGDMMVGVSRMLESNAALSSKEKVEGFRSTELSVDDGRWKSMGCVLFWNESMPDSCIPKYRCSRETGGVYCSFGYGGVGGDSPSDRNEQDGRSTTAKVRAASLNARPKTSDGKKGPVATRRRRRTGSRAGWWW
jgi:hypothetical protein